ncbi:hypothetical protein TNCV_4173591 [Trichonephila clavipes]|nr:hypothetical protein TNCV_4173591 [Trichonephila clavipes]
MCYALESPETLEILKKAYGNDSAPEGFYLFPWLKVKLQEPRFVDTDDAIQNATNVSWGKTYENNSTRLPYKDFDFNSGELTKNHVNDDALAPDDRRRK